MLQITWLNNIRQRPSISILKRFINYILIDRYIDPTKLPRTYSTKWATQFYKCQKVILKTKVPKEVKRQAAKDPILIKEWFNTLGRDIKKYSVQYEDIYNIDKLGVCIGQGKKEKVLLIYNKAVRYKAGKAFSYKSVTVIETIYADGHIIPPLIIFKGKTY